MTSPLIRTWLSNGKDIPSHLKSSLAKLSKEHCSGIPIRQLDSPMMKQYRAAKEEIPDALLFFRMGDFYELFGVDAVIVSDICALTLTSRDKSSNNPVPMAGTPVISYKSSLRKCLQAGFKIAVCDQVEDPRQAKGIVRREITRISTPAVPGDLGEDLPENNFQRGCYLACVIAQKNQFSFAYVDVSNGDFKITTQLTKDLLTQEITTIQPKEILVQSTQEDFIKTILREKCGFYTVINTIESWLLRSEQNAKELFLEFFSEKEFHSFGIDQLDMGLQTVAPILYYLKLTQKTVLKNIQKISYYELKNYLIIDESTRKHLDFFVTSNGEKRGSLFHFLNQCATSTGSRLLIRKINYPFKHQEDIEKSHNIIQYLSRHVGLIAEVYDLLKNTADIERLLSRAAQKGLDTKGMAWLRQTLFLLKKLYETCTNRSNSPLESEFISIQSSLQPLALLANYLFDALVDDPSQQLGKEGSVFKTGFHTELDELVDLETNFNQKLEKLEAFERERSQISSLKIGFNRVFGYYFEISKGKLSQVPKHFMRKQTLSTGERFITEELKELEEKFLHATEKKAELEKTLIETVRLQILENAPFLVEASTLIANIDIYVSFAKVALQYNWCKPVITEHHLTKLTASTHPILANLNQETSSFIKNNILLGEDGLVKANIHLITGPNMSGKSTMMRQIALTQVLCQMGSFVPAESAIIGLVDRILTRIGSGDNALKNQSTFMVEMLETSYILRMATSRSLLLLDEIGRGTSTFDGLSLAWAILEYIHDKIAARTLFSTHYHELVNVCTKRPSIIPMRMSVVESIEKQADGSEKRDILFSRKYEQGHSEKSYGLHVAALAALPQTLIDRAECILKDLEHSHISLENNPQVKTDSRRPKQRPSNMKDYENTLF